ncbi:unnamed protein product [Didymodactylos carnosus]|uniref:Uncharacterized protein n=1 Tax=Didymodactylos carnosus TaxID=1234261 RepID=A0A8S2KD64_9BILA|nr:unnamed protein product [Didymodactylos carnosus]CAF3849065.1 unnamed protein product [Didymodactylos carnosus]
MREITPRKTRNEYESSDDVTSSIQNILGSNDLPNKNIEILEGSRCYRAVICQKWLEMFIHGTLEDFTAENRGGKHVSTVYEYFPEIEMDAKAFATQKCQQKSAAFNVTRPSD